MLAERRSSPSPSPSRGISIGSRISAIGARLSRRSSNAGDSQQNKSEDQDSISPILGRTGECFHEIYGGVVVVVRVHVRLMSESEIRDKKVWATLSSLLIGALIFAPRWRTQRFTPDAPLRSAFSTLLLVQPISNRNSHLTDTERSISRGREAFVSFSSLHSFIFLQSWSLDIHWSWRHRQHPPHLSISRCKVGVRPRRFLSHTRKRTC